MSRSTASGLIQPGLPTIALRVPAHPAMQALLTAVGRPLAAPSANASGRISPTRASHVLASLDGRIPLVIDGGATERGIESTIVAATDGGLRLLRRGPVQIEAEETSSAIEAPGMLASHYAPAKPLRLDAVQAADDEYLIGFGPVSGAATLSAEGDPVEAAARLFDLLHQADEAPQPRIAVAPIPGNGLAAAIRDRPSKSEAGSVAGASVAGASVGAGASVAGSSVGAGSSVAGAPPPHAASTTVAINSIESNTNRLRFTFLLQEKIR